MANVGQAGVETGVVVVHADEVERHRWQDVPQWDGAVERTFWQDANFGSCAGVMSLAPAASHARHAHHDVAHHMWILSGSLRIGDEMVGRGSYVHIPRGVEHGPQTAGPEGCTFFFVYDAD